MAAPVWTDFAPTAFEAPGTGPLVRNAVARITRAEPTEVEPLRTRLFDALDQSEVGPEIGLELRIALSILCDLRSHGWDVRSRGGLCQIRRPDHGSLEMGEAKAQIRSSLVRERDDQLRQDATRRFLAGMERQHVFQSKWVSVFDLMRDGSKLADELRSLSCLEAEERATGLARTIEPYVQVVERGTACQLTGFDLQDIWRYFRHTWVTPYRSLPGRQISFLVRDHAAPFHPVIGIASLGSAVVQQKQRDMWIGWHPDAFLKRLEAEKYRGWARWVEDRLGECLEEICIDDFLEEGLLDSSDLEAPKPASLKMLQEVSVDARRRHRLFRQAEIHKRAGREAGPEDWVQQAQTHLFRSKRAGRLLEVLEIRAQLRDAGFVRPRAQELRKATQIPTGRRAVRRLLRLVRARHLAADVMDIVVCGAVAPYNALLGGKLVALLLATPEVIGAYRERYRGQSSVIASSIAGRPISREPRLSLLTTTSLFGTSSSQYNRIRMPVGETGAEIKYHRIKRTAGYGSYQYSQRTLEGMDILLARAARGREVNSIFGEGVSPKLRKIRAALSTIGLDYDGLLQHGSPRLIYAVPLADNFRDVLVGRTKRPSYVLPREGANASDVIQWWRSRWLDNRVKQEEVLREISGHSIEYPVTHGARVKTPEEQSHADPESLWYGA